MSVPTDISKLNLTPVVKLWRMKLPLKAPVGIDSFNTRTCKPKEGSSNTEAAKNTRSTRKGRNSLSKADSALHKATAKSVRLKGHGVLKSRETENRYEKTDNVKDKDETLDNSDNFDGSLQKTQCPHCEFKCQRASALKFHVNFIHGGKKESTKRAASKDAGQTPVKKVKHNAKVDKELAKTVETDLRTGRMSEGNTSYLSNVKKGKAKVNRPDNNGNSSVYLEISNSYSSNDKVPKLSYKSQRENIEVSNSNQLRPVSIIDKNDLPMTKTVTEGFHHQSAVIGNSMRKIDLDKEETNKRGVKATNNEKGSFRFEHKQDYDKDDDDEGDDDDDFEEETNKQPDRKEPSYSCHICKKDFKLLESAKMHVKIEHPNNDLSNVRIKNVKRREKESPRVMIKIVEKGCLKCPFCDETANQMSKIKEHIEAVHKSKNLQNNIKGTCFGGKQQMPKDETDKKASPGNFKCPFCPFTVALKSLLVRHVKNNHQQNRPDLASYKAEQSSKLTMSEICKTKSTISTITAERKDDSDDSANSDKIISDQSGKVNTDSQLKTYGDKINLESVEKHNTANCKDIMEKNGLNRISEDMEINHAHVNSENGIPDYDYDQLKNLESDTKEDGKLKKYTCEICSRHFGSYQAFWTHKKVHHNAQGKAYECGMCSQTFTFQHELNKHEQKHTDPAGRHLYCCDYDGCGKVYTEKKALYRHLKSKHEEANPAARLSTRKAWSAKGEMANCVDSDKEQADLVKKEPTLTCFECKITFKNQSSLWRHDLRFHKKKDKQHKCKICMKMFLFAHELKDHMFVHIHKTDISCPTDGCHFKTKKLKYLANHLRLFHGQKIDIKTLGEHVLSQEQITPGELLDLFPLASVKTETGITPQGTTETEPDQHVEPDKQIEMLVANIYTISETNAQSTTGPEKTGPGSEANNELVSEVDGTGDSVKDPAGDSKMAQTNETEKDQDQMEDAVATTEEMNGDMPDSPGTIDTIAEKPYKCKACKKAFPSHRQLIKHKVSDHPKDLTIHKCDKCTKVFFTGYDLKDHKDYHHPGSKDHVCEVCGKSFPILSVLQKHLTRHQQKTEEMVDSGQGEAVCDICGLSLRYRGSLQHHMQTAHPEKLTCSCKICSAQSDNLEHINVSALPFCSMCNRYFCKKAFFESHMRVIHNTTGRHTCNFCPEKFSTLSQKNLHMHQTHAVLNGPQASEDPDVGQISTQKDDTHIIEISNEDQSGPKFLPKLSEQGLKAVTKELKIYSEEGGEKHWKCLLCGQCFLKVKYFNLHVRRTHVLPEHQPYRCKICTAGFVRVGEFRKHTRTHSGFRPLKCRICHKSFKQQAHLKEHILIHADTRKYKCELCPRRFKQRGALLAHVVKHDKLKPFKCHYCGVGYTVRGALSKHMRKYIGNESTETHLCHICHKTFSHYPMLLRHIYIHQQPSPFICETCHRTFAAYTSLYFHKCKEKHFIAQDYETEDKKKHIRRVTEVKNAVNSLNMESEEGQVNSEIEILCNQECVEIEVKDMENEEGTAVIGVESHADEELLSIAKQLTEMSTYPGHEVYIDTDNQNTIEEEEKIMMTMLDADDEIKSNLERSLMMSKTENGQAVKETSFQIIHEVKETNFQISENTFVQIFQCVDENGVQIENVDENGVPMEHIVESHVPIEIDESNSQIQQVDEKGDMVDRGTNLDTDKSCGQIKTVYVPGDEVSIEHVTTANATSEGVSVSGVENVSENRDQTQDVDKNDLVVNICSNNVQANQISSSNDVHLRYHMLESGMALVHINKSSSNIQNHGDSSACSKYEDDNTLHRKLNDENTTVQCADDTGSTTKDCGDHVVITEGKIVERSEEHGPEKFVMDAEEHATTTVCNQQSDQILMLDGNMKTNMQDDCEIQNSQVSHLTQVVQDVSNLKHTTEDNISNGQVVVIEYVDNKRVAPGNSEYIVTGNDDSHTETSKEMQMIDENSEAYTSQLAKALTQDHFTINYTQSEHYITAGTTAGSSGHEKVDLVQAAEASDEVADSEMPESQVEQTTYEQTNIPVGDVNQIEDQDVGNTDSYDLTPVNIAATESGDLTEPMYVFRKADGSLVYICINKEQPYNTNEIAAVGPEVFQDIRDHSTLEAAENLQSLAESNNTGLESEAQKMQEVNEQNIQINVFENMDTAEIEANHPLYEVINNSPAPNFSSLRRILVNPEDSSQQTIVYECSICHIHLKTKKNLRDHLKRHNTKEDRPFGCQQCLKRFFTKSELVRHNRIHSDDRPCECKICGKKFRQPGHLTTHIRTHTGEKPFPCKLCGARFTTSTLLKTHILVHSDERNFECGVCEMKFKALKDLRRHRAVHSGIMSNKRAPTSTEIQNNSSSKAVCHLCGKVFKNKHMLKTHIAAEENLREFKCKVCGQGFNTRVNLHYHYQTHENKPPVVCEVCGKSFKRPATLKLHMKIHDSMGKDGSKGQSVFPCPACNKPFNHRGALYYHIGVSPDCMSKGFKSTEASTTEATNVDLENNTQTQLSAASGIIIDSEKTSEIEANDAGQVIVVSGMDKEIEKHAADRVIYDSDKTSEIGANDAGEVIVVSRIDTETIEQASDRVIFDSDKTSEIGANDAGQVIVVSGMDIETKEHAADIVSLGTENTSKIEANDAGQVIVVSGMDTETKQRAADKLV